MWRAFFLAMGISLGILGGECLLVQKVVLARTAAAASGPLAAITEAGRHPHEIEPPEWAPWSLMSAGAVVLLYCFTLPRRARGED